MLENIHDPHNVSAIFRTCDAVGISEISLLYNYEKFPKIGRKSSASANKWIEKEKYKTVDECFSYLREKGFQILATSLNSSAKDLYDINFSKKIAVVLGNEHRGISKEVEERADFTFFIPMYGMVQSLNVSVAAAVILYEALRQRRKKGLYDKSNLSESELNRLIDTMILKR